MDTEVVLLKENFCVRDAVDSSLLRSRLLKHDSKTIISDETLSFMLFELSFMPMPLKC